MKRQRIVLAEDHSAVAEQLRALLADEYEVSVVNDGGALLRAIQRDRPDALITDIAMPGKNGLMAARAALDLHPDLTIVFVSVSNPPEMIRHTQSLGALGYVMKCDAGEELLAAVRAALAGRHYLSLHARRALGEP